MTTLDNDWEQFNTIWEQSHDTSGIHASMADFTLDPSRTTLADLGQAPEPTALYISTTSMMAKLSTPIDHYALFWNIPVQSYAALKQGVVKKQIKQSAHTDEERKALDDALERHRKETESPCLLQILFDRDKKDRMKFRHERKVSVGISKKDMLGTSIPTKAMYNCVVIIYRLYEKGQFREYHIKVCNTGCVEVLGIHDKNTFDALMQQLVSTIINPYQPAPVSYINQGIILTNSNFNCNYLIDREKLYRLMQTKYQLKPKYDPCRPHQAIRTKFYYYPQSPEPVDGRWRPDNGPPVSICIMIFRTGSVVIVGHCSSDEAQLAYQFMVALLKEEYPNVLLQIT